MYNPSLREIPRSQLAELLPAQQEPSILTWLEGTGRLKPLDDEDLIKDDSDNEELSDLMGDGDRYEDDDLSLGDDDDD